MKASNPFPKLKSKLKMSVRDLRKKKKSKAKGKMNKFLRHNLKAVNTAFNDF